MNLRVVSEVNKVEHMQMRQMANVISYSVVGDFSLQSDECDLPLQQRITY